MSELTTNPTQGTDDWRKQRLGKVTASKMSDMLAKTKSGWGASRANYAAQLLVERLTGQPQEAYQNGARQWGTDTEPKARDAYQFMTDNEVVEVGFIDHPTIAMSGASPDGTIGDDGLIEIKCPNTATHLDTMLGDGMPDKYIKQIQWQLACTGRKWCDFVSFDPRLPADLQMRVIRVDRDDVLIATLEDETRVFLKEIDDKIAALNARKEAA